MNGNRGATQRDSRSFVFFAGQGDLLRSPIWSIPSFVIARPTFLIRLFHWHHHHTPVDTPNDLKCERNIRTLANLYARRANSCKTNPQIFECLYHVFHVYRPAKKGVATTRRAGVKGEEKPLTLAGGVSPPLAAYAAANPTSSPRHAPYPSFNSAGGDAANLHSSLRISAPFAGEHRFVYAFLDYPRALILCQRYPHLKLAPTQFIPTALKKGAPRS
jgi:hypothetical protein